MKVLAVDTSTPVSSVALLAEGSVQAEIAAQVRSRHGETLLSHVQHVLDIGEIDFEAVELLAVGLGPGSFTGLRVGLATVQGLAVSRGIPLVGGSSLEALGRGLGYGEDMAVPVVDAHKGEVYAAAYRPVQGAPLSEVLAPIHGTPEQVARRLREAIPDRPLVLCGDGLRKYEQRLLSELGPPHFIAPPVHDVPRAALLSVDAERRYGQHGADDPARLEPMYLRPSDAKYPQGR
jgi:tRNA threonylcarbamoyladenosine biosynthesis protein TsaB